MTTANTTSNRLKVLFVGLRRKVKVEEIQNRLKEVFRRKVYVSLSIRAHFTSSLSDSWI